MAALHRRGRGAKINRNGVSPIEGKATGKREP